jgi:DNA-binding CsgD family transcriptional regulator
MHGVTLTTAEHVLHSCDNKGCPGGRRLCCNPRHLYKGDQIQNSQDMKDRERHGLPHHTVRAIKVLCVEGEQSDSEIAAKFGISRRHVNNIRNGNRYDHVQIEQETGNE